MYSVKIRDHIMIAHSFNDKFFGPAQKLHGATYIVDVCFYASQLNEHNVVVDISQVQDVLRCVLDSLRYNNLDNLPEFENQLTTTEYLARFIHDKVKKSCSNFFKGKISVTLGESHIAWASYEGE
jgi:6-pyruvoyl-tetrahydropterin synthase